MYCLLITAKSFLIFKRITVHINSQYVLSYFLGVLFRQQNNVGKTIKIKITTKSFSFHLKLDSGVHMMQIIIWAEWHSCDSRSRTNLFFTILVKSNLVRIILSKIYKTLLCEYNLIILSIKCGIYIIKYLSSMSV